jgi:hypothetical protein
MVALVTSFLILLVTIDTTTQKQKPLEVGAFVFEKKCFLVPHL